MNSVVDSLFIGTSETLKGSRLKTAISKRRVREIVVDDERLLGDQVANLKYHGGSNRVLHQYCSDHYNYWNQQLSTESCFPGCLGENLSAGRMNEDNVCVGDIYHIGEVHCQVTEPRKPCGTINLKMGIKGFYKEIEKEGRTGWFYKILKPGRIQEGDSIELQQRPYPLLTLTNCIKALWFNQAEEILAAMAVNPILSPSWRDQAKALSNTGL